MPASALEKHYSLKEIAVLWHMSVSGARKLFEGRPDVIRFGHRERLKKRQYISVRVPESTLQRVHAELLRGVK